MCVVGHEPRQVLDESAARRMEEERRSLCPEHNGTVLHLVPRDIDMFDPDALSYWMSVEASEGLVARAAVVPSGITALRHHIRWAFFSPQVAFRVFRNPQVAKSWLVDCWLQHLEEQAASLHHSDPLAHEPTAISS